MGYDPPKGHDLVAYPSWLRLGVSSSPLWSPLAIRTICSGYLFPSCFFFIFPWLLFSYFYFSSVRSLNRMDLWVAGVRVVYMLCLVSSTMACHDGIALSTPSVDNIW